MAAPKLMTYCVLVLFVAFMLVSKTNCVEILQKPSLSNPVPVYQFEEPTDGTSCVNEIQKLLEPAQLSKLMSTVSLSGKGLNDLGNFDGCNKDEDFKYALLVVELNGQKNTGFAVGLCTPLNCASKYEFLYLTDYINTALESSDANAYVSFPDEDNEAPLEAGFYATLIIIILLCTCMAIGLLVQFTEAENTRKFNSQELKALKVQDRKSKIGLFFYSFSPAQNFVSLFTIKKSEDRNLVVLNGIRTLSICWVVLGHTYIMDFGKPVVNIMNTSLLFEPFSFSIITAAPYAVDVFFMLSGFLTFYLITLKMYPKNGFIGTKKFFLLYFHRYYRLIFPVAFVMLFTRYMMIHLGNGPFYKEDFRNNFMYTNCKDKWWPNLLFINNFYPWKMKDECIGWVWYLANDFQFYLISPPIIFMYCLSRKSAYFCVYVLITICILYNGIISGVLNIGPAETKGDKISQGDIVYSKPWARMATYFIGAALGFGYFEKTFQNKYQELKESTFNKYFSLMTRSGLFCWIQALFGCALMILFVLPMRSYIKDCTDENCWSIPVTVLFTSFYRVGFVTGMLFVILPTMCNRFDAIKYILSANIFTIGARLTYCVYMIHILVLVWFFGDSRQGFYNTNLYLTVTGIGTILVSFIIAIPVSMLCETPFMNIEKYVLFPSPIKIKKVNDSILLAKERSPSKYMEKEEDSTFNSEPAHNFKVAKRISDKNVSQS